MASNTAKNAAKIQTDASKEAMAYTQGNTDKALQFILGQQAGTKSPMQTSPAYARMYQGLGLGQPFKAAYGPQAGPAVGGGDTVMMRAPNGMTKAVPKTDVAHFRQRGAELV